MDFFRRFTFLVCAPSFDPDDLEGMRLQQIITQVEKLGFQVVRARRIEDAELAVQADAAIGCMLVDVAADPPTTVGEIENVDRSAGPAPLLMVKSAKGEVLVPFAKSYLRTVDLQNRRLEMALPLGLTDLNG